MVSCPRCGEQTTEQGAAEGFCMKCGASLTDTDIAKDAGVKQSSQKTAAFGTRVASGGGVPTGGEHSFQAQVGGEPADVGDSFQELIRPRELSPEYENRVTAAWQATHSILQNTEETINPEKTIHRAETIKLSAGATEQSFGLHIGTRKVLESTDDPNADYELIEELGKGGMGKVWSA